LRFYKAIEITRPEADYLIKMAGASRNSIAVMSYGGAWYDVRALTRGELDDFVAHLVRKEIANVQAGSVTRH
jgi:hypothetical protein